jgi:hypothetical protein
MPQAQWFKAVTCSKYESVSAAVHVLMICNNQVQIPLAHWAALASIVLLLAILTPL